MVVLPQKLGFTISRIPDGLKFEVGDLRGLGFRGLGFRVLDSQEVDFCSTACGKDASARLHVTSCRQDSATAGLYFAVAAGSFQMAMLSGQLCLETMTERFDHAPMQKCNMLFPTAICLVFAKRSDVYCHGSGSLLQ